MSSLPRKLIRKSDFPDFPGYFEHTFVDFSNFLPSWRSLVPKFGFYKKCPPQNRLKISGRLQEPPKTLIFLIFLELFKNVVVDFLSFLPSGRSLVPKFGFYEKCPPQNRLECQMCSGKLQRKTGFAGFLRILTRLCSEQKSEKVRPSVSGGFAKCLNFLGKFPKAFS